MKVPKTFRTEKNLDHKTEELIREANLPDSLTIQPDVIRKMAKEIIFKKQSLLLNSSRLNNRFHRSISYKDIHSGIIIEYTYWYNFNKQNKIDGHVLRIILGEYEVFKQHGKDDNPRTITYVHNDWQKDLKEMYQEIKDETS